MRHSQLQSLIHSKLLNLINQEVKKGQKIPTELSLAKRFDVSRTVIRKVINQMQLSGIIDNNKIRTGKVLPEEMKTAENKTEENEFQVFFFQEIKDGFILPGQKFSVLELANKSGCNRTIVREFLYQFAQYGLIEKFPRKMWGMVGIDAKYLDELVKARITLETKQLKKLKHNQQNRSAFLKNGQLILIKTNQIANLSIQELQDIEIEYFRQLFLVDENRFITNFHQHLHYLSCFLFQWVQEDITDQIDSRLVFLYQIQEAVELNDIEQAIETVAAFYFTFKEQFLTSLDLLQTP